MSTLPTFGAVSAGVLVIGAGRAGPAPVLSWPRMASTALDKRAHGDAHTVWAAGGINASLGSLGGKDPWELYATDMLDEGHFANDPTAVEMLYNRAPDRIRELAEWDMAFDRTDDRKINQRYSGTQSFRRTCVVGGRTGQALSDTSVSSVGTPK